MLCQIRIEKRKISFLLGILGRTFFVKSRLLITFYSNKERKGQYTGWVEEVVILGPTHDPKLRDIKEYTSLGLIRDLRQE